MHLGFYNSNLEQERSNCWCPAQVREMNFSELSLSWCRDVKFPRDRKVGKGGICFAVLLITDTEWKEERNNNKKKDPPGVFKTPVHTNQTPPRIAVWNEAKQCCCNTLINAINVYISASVCSKPLTPKPVQDEPLLFSPSPKTVSTLDARWGTID